MEWKTIEIKLDSETELSSREEAGEERLQVVVGKAGVLKDHANLRAGAEEAYPSEVPFPKCFPFQEVQEEEGEVGTDSFQGEAAEGKEEEESYNQSREAEEGKSMEVSRSLEEVEGEGMQVAAGYRLWTVAGEDKQSCCCSQEGIVEEEQLSHEESLRTSDWVCLQ